MIIPTGKDLGRVAHPRNATFGLNPARDRHVVVSELRLNL